MNDKNSLIAGRGPTEEDPCGAGPGLDLVRIQRAAIAQAARALDICVTILPALAAGGVVHPLILP